MNLGPPLGAIGLLLALALAGTAAVRVNGSGAPPADDAPTLRQLGLRFEDGSDGSLRVRDAASQRLLYTANRPGEDGFLRSTVRGLARERKRRGLDDTVPFELLARSDGRLTLLDPATGRRIELEAFGRTNAGAFALLFKESP